MRVIAAFLALLLFVPNLPAQDVKRTHDINIDDYFTQADIQQIALSPDGKFVAYTEARWRESTDDRKTDLWLVDTQNKLKGGPPRGAGSLRLTHDRCGARSPQWAPDGKTIYFLANRKREGDKQPPFNGKAQVWRVRWNGNDLTPVTQLTEGVDAFQISEDGAFIHYQVSYEKVLDDWSGLRGKHRGLDYGHGVEKLSQIWRLDLDSFRARKIVDEGRNIREFTATPDGSKIAMITTPDDKVVSFEGQSKVEIYDAKTGKIVTVPDKAFRKDMPSPYAWLEHLAWSPKGGRLAFNAVFDGYPAEVMLVDVAADPPAVTKLDRGSGYSIKGYGSPLQWKAENWLWFLGETKARVHLMRAGGIADGPSSAHVAVPGDVVVEGISGDPRCEATAVVLGTPTKFPDVYLLENDSKLRRLTNVNPQAESWKLPQLSVVTWKGAGGQAVEGVLELPPDYKPGQKVPLVLEIHGGPTTASYYKLQYWIYGRTLLPAKGHAVLCPNYRGSTGYGDKFLTDLIGRENDLDVEDILKGVDHLVEQGIADPDKLAVSGWSNGGYLTNCIITKTNRFKAAISGAGIVDAVMEWGSNDEPAYSMVFKKGFPWSSADTYHKASSTYSLDKIRTPTLIHVGANDERCPPGQSRMLYRALKEYLHVPTELIVYPGEGHGVMKYRHRRAKMEWDLAWLERFVQSKQK
ncbi:MAG: S9 family peptidase [Planctomycetes bacterium]|nr:S9 family peptidase [Planctomycetota bacterium]